MGTVEVTISAHNLDNMVNEKLKENEDKISLQLPTTCSRQWKNYLERDQKI